MFSMLSAPAIAVAAPTDEVAFENAAFKNCVLTQLGFAEDATITEADLASLTALTCKNMLIENIEPLAFATGLRTLDLQHNMVSDLTPLAGLTKLEVLALVSNNVADLQPIAGLPKVTSLELNGNRITDLTPIQNITTLRYLLLHDNQISDLTPLAGLSNLQNIQIRNNHITDISPIGGLTKLTAFNGAAQVVADAEAVVGTPALSPIRAADGSPIPLSVTSGDGTVSGNEVIWNQAGAGGVTWNAPFTLPNGNTGTFSGRQAVTVSPAPAVALEGIPLNGVVGTSYTFDFALTGYPSIPEVSVISGSIPAGLSLSRDGKITGLPTKAGSYDFLVKVSNGLAEREYSFTVVITDNEAPKPKPEPEVDKGAETGGKLANTGADAPTAGALLGTTLVAAGTALALTRLRKTRR